MGEELKFNIYGLKIQPRDADENANPYEFCQEKGVVGIGWGLSNDTRYETKEGLKEVYKNKGLDRAFTPSGAKLKASIRYMVEDINENDYVWVNEKSKYVLCRITSTWKYKKKDKGTSCEWSKNDIHNYRNAEWIKVSPELVPGYVLRYFSGRSGTLNHMKKGVDDGARKYLKKLYEAAKTIETKDITKSITAKDLENKFEEKNINKRIKEESINLLSPDELEDVVLYYLQSEGNWLIRKSTTSRSHPGVECELRREKEGGIEISYVQIKSGGAGVSQNELNEYAKNEQAKILIFEAEPSEEVSEKPFERIKIEDIVGFMKSKSELLSWPIKIRLLMS